jgi:large subunit ribosomal protein L13
MDTYATKESDIKREWRLVDAAGQPLGRLASQVAAWLKGKHKPYYSTHLDTGDYVVIINAARVKLTGTKLKKGTEKVYPRHTGYPGGFRSDTVTDLLDKHPTRVVEKAIKGMLPHNNLGREMYRKLKVYAGDKHPHEAQIKGVNPAKKMEAAE